MSLSLAGASTLDRMSFTIALSPPPRKCGLTDHGGLGMRKAVTISILVAMVGAVSAQKKEPPPVRYGIEADLEAYPQDTVKAAMSSVLRTIEARRFDYLAAQLADPDGVDKRVQELGGKFEKFVKIVAERYGGDPEAIRELRRIVAEGEVNESGDAASISHKQIKGRQVFLRKSAGRWFLEDRIKPEK
jgi:hypothetical protein